jgi:hypothetical protein
MNLPGGTTNVEAYDRYPRKIADRRRANASQAVKLREAVELDPCLWSVVG